MVRCAGSWFRSVLPSAQRSRNGFGAAEFSGDALVSGQRRQRHQVLSVVSTGGSTREDGRLAARRQRVETGGHRNPSPRRRQRHGSAIHDGEMATPMGIFSLDFAFGTQPDPAAAWTDTCR